MSSGYITISEYVFLYYAYLAQKGTHVLRLRVHKKDLDILPSRKTQLFVYRMLWHLYVRVDRGGWRKTQRALFACILYNYQKRAVVSCKQASTSVSRGFVSRWIVESREGSGHSKGQAARTELKLNTVILYYIFIKKTYWETLAISLRRPSEAQYTFRLRRYEGDIEFKVGSGNRVESEYFFL